MSDGACYACDPRNPDRIVSTDGDGWLASFPGRFVGVPGAVNGGMAVGALACPALMAAQREGASRAVVRGVAGRLRLPVPLESPLGVTVDRVPDGYEVALFDGDVPGVTGSVDIAQLDSHARPGDRLPGGAPGQRQTDVEAMARLVNAEPRREPLYVEQKSHSFPTCFSCGPDNRRGLRILPRGAGPHEVWSRWRPDASFRDGHGGLATAIVASALDCSTAWAAEAGDGRSLPEDEVMLLGSFDVRFLRVPPIAVDGDYRVIGRWLGRDGRKGYGTSGLFDAQGTAYAIAEAVWITVARPK